MSTPHLEATGHKLPQPLTCLYPQPSFFRLTPLSQDNKWPLRPLPGGLLADQSTLSSSSIPADPPLCVTCITSRHPCRGWGLPRQEHTSGTFAPTCSSPHPEGFFPGRIFWNLWAGPPHGPWFLPPGAPVRAPANTLNGSPPHPSTQELVLNSVLSPILTLLCTLSLPHSLSRAANALRISPRLLFFFFIVAVFGPEPWSKFSFPTSFFLEVTPQTSSGELLQRL